MAQRLSKKVKILRLLPDKGVDLGHFDIVQLLDGRLDLRLVGSQVSDEHKSVVVFDLLHGRLSGQWIFNDRELIQSLKKFIKTSN